MQRDDNNGWYIMSVSEGGGNNNIEYNSTGNELSCKSYCDVYKIRFGAKQIQYERVVDCGRSLPEALVSLTFFSAAW